MGYEQDELITIGERFDADALIHWSGRIIEAARQDLARLSARGITEETLRAAEVAKADAHDLKAHAAGDGSTLASARREAISAALDWRQEVRGLAEALFDSEPETLARFRTGVKTSRSLPKLLAEVGFLVGTLRDHLPAFAGVGADDSLLRRGEEAFARLDEAQRRLVEERAQVPPKTLELQHALGVLYTRGRFLARIAGVEFRGDAERLARYSYEPLRAPAPAKRPRSRATASRK